MLDISDLIRTILKVKEQYVFTTPISTHTLDLRSGLRSFTDLEFTVTKIKFNDRYLCF